MKKIYEAPAADKIAFNYRDQVVAASGDNVTGGNGTTGWNNNLLSGCVPQDQIDDYFWSSSILDVCSSLRA